MSASDTFIRAIEKFLGSVGPRNSMVFRKVVLDVYSEIVRTTPVDTGLARGNWRIGVDQIPEGTVERKGRGPQPEEMGQIHKGMKLTPNTVVYIANNLVYIVPLEYGHSKQAPHGMVAQAMNRIVSAMGR